MLALALLQSALAQAVTTVSPERPSQEAAAALVGLLWEDLPDSGLVIYLACPQRDCAGRAPAWFTQASWDEGLAESGLGYDGAPPGIHPVDLAVLEHRLAGMPPLLAQELLRDLEGDGVSRAFLFVHPAARGEKLQLSWELHGIDPYMPPTRGRLDVRVAAPPVIVDLPPPTPYLRRPAVLGGMGLALAGAATLGGTWSAYMDGASEGSAGLGLAHTAGWASLMAGATLMASPLLMSGR